MLSRLATMGVESQARSGMTGRFSRTNTPASA